MACQGCGKPSENRLCCPTCIELGRTSFFCGQDCFTKYWGTHNELHKLLRKKKAHENEISSTDAGTADATQTPSAPSAPSRPATSTTFQDRSYQRAAPLPGGMPLQKWASASNAAAVKKSDDNGSQPPGVFDSLVGHAKAMLGAPNTGAGNFATALKSRFGSQPSEDAKTRPRGRGRSESPSPKGQGKGPGSASKSRSVVSFQNLLWLLVIITIAAGGFFYRQYQRLPSDLPSNQVSLTSAASAASDVVLAKTSDGSDVRSSDVVVVDQPVSTQKAESASTADSNAAPGALIASLRADLASIREVVDRHEKMLRYVMDRYVEKDQQLSSPTDKADGVKEASVEKFTATGTSNEAEAASTKARADNLRRRKAGGDVSMESMVGMPQPENKASAEAGST